MILSFLTSHSALFSPSPETEIIWHNYLLNLLNMAVCRERREAAKKLLGTSGGAAEIYSSGRTVCPRDKHQCFTLHILSIQKSGKKKTMKSPVSSLTSPVETQQTHGRSCSARIRAKLNFLNSSWCRDAFLQRGQRSCSDENSILLENLLEAEKDLRLRSTFHQDNQSDLQQTESD